jgi:hypothetical protein
MRLNLRGSCFIFYETGQIEDSEEMGTMMKKDAVSVIDR